MSKKLTAIIIDDERIARSVLRSYLSEFPEIEIVGEAGNVKTAINVIKKTNPSVIFLDIQMPGETGFDLLEKVKVDFHVIFVTAHDEFAIRAFEVNALDYLLKPIKKTRLKNTIERLQGDIHTESKLAKTNYNDRLLLNVHGYIKMIPIKNIIKISSDKDYSCVLLHDGNEIRLLKTLKEWIDKLPTEYFGQVHRSTIINFEYIEKIEKSDNQSYNVYLQKIKEPVIMSRRFGASLKTKLKF